MCPVCKNKELELGQKYCQICGEPLEWEEDKLDHFVEANKTIGKDINDPTKWIPVEERLPVQGEPVWATIKHSEWINDYDTDWLPEEEKKYHPESYGVYKAEGSGSIRMIITNGYTVMQWRKRKGIWQMCMTQ